MKWEDAETGHRQYVDTSSAAVRNVYSAHWNRRMDSLRQLLNRNRVDHIEISTADATSARSKPSSQTCTIMTIVQGK